MDLARYVVDSARRLRAARGIADSLRHDNALHRLALNAVFVLEDCHETLLRMRHATTAKLERTGRLSPPPVGTRDVL